MVSVGVGSAPDKVDALKPLWEDFSEEKRQRMAYQWIDYCVRDVLALLCDGSGKADLAEILRALPAVIDEATKAQAKAVVASMPTKIQPAKPLAVGSIFTVTILVLTFLNEPPSITRACFMTVMVSRMAFGDDHLMQMFEQDLKQTRTTAR